MPSVYSTIPPASLGWRGENGINVTPQDLVIIGVSVKQANQKVIISGPRTFFEYHIVRNLLVRSNYTLVVQRYSSDSELVVPSSIITQIVDFYENANSYNSVAWMERRSGRKYGYAATKVCPLCMSKLNGFIGCGNK